MVPVCITLCYAHLRTHSLPLSANFDSLTRYLPLFDTQRGALLDVYHPSATFSFSANTAIPTRARIEGFHSSPSMPNQRKLDWTAWLQGGLGGSRNLSRLAGGLEKMTKTLHIGSVQIIEAMTNLPATRHEITSSPDRFCVDAWPIPHGEGMGLFVTLHGQFTEGESFSSVNKAYYWCLMFSWCGSAR